MEKEHWYFDELIALIMVLVGLLMMMLAFNYKTLRLSLNGYSPSQINMILEMDERMQEVYLQG